MPESRLFATVAENLPDGVIILDAESGAAVPRILFVNTAFSRLTGFSTLDVLGRDLCSLVGPHFDPAVIGRLHEALALGNTFTAETVNHAGESLVQVLVWSLIPARNSAGRITQGVVLLRDVTELRRTERLLLQVQKVDSIGLLSSGVAHDFNNQLTVLKASGELGLMDPSVSPNLRALLQQIVATSERAATLTRQLLHYSRQQAPSFGAVDLNALINQVGRMLSRLLGENIRFDLRLAAELPRVFADAAMLEQVVVNLVVNARDALTTDGHITVETEDVFLPRATPRHPQAGRHVRLLVRDNGRGIPPEHLSQIFEPFFTTKPEGEGTGLGLSTVQSIARQHQGWVEVDSAPGRGTAFSVYLPARPDLEPQRVSGAPAASAGLRGGHEAILVVEDDAIVRTVTTQILEHFGYNVTAVRTGPEALRVVHSGASRPDLLLADHILPEGLHGRHLVETLRSNHQQLRAILMSGNTPRPDDLAWLQHSRTPFLHKPFSVEALAHIVRETLDHEPTGITPITGSR